MTRLGIYVQVPFCQTKCTYCNFHTGVFAKSLYQPYVSAVCRELTGHAALCRATGLAESLSTAIVDTVYLGGGTPSLLEPSALTQVVAAVTEGFGCRIEEITLEADP